MAVAAQAKNVSQALAALHDPAALERHPFAAELGGGRALRRALERAIGALRVHGPRVGRAARRHELLRLRYVEMRPVEDVRRLLQIGRLHYYREHERAIRAVATLLRPHRPSHEASEGSPARLPVQLTSFVGRERQISDVLRLLGSSRLVTLTGAGGVGKTRLGQRVAVEAAASCVDGVRAVELASIGDGDLVARTVAAAFGLREDARRPALAMLTDFLRDRELLLLLDNCEHVLPGTVELTLAILGGCPRVRVLATSREPLGVPGETAWRVPSLLLPAKTDRGDPDALAEYEAVRLFVDRAQAVQKDFSLGPENAPAVAQICQRLDGMPLAIELAAARVRVLSPSQIAERLGDGFRLLSSGRGGLPRHRTLRALVDWSHDLLADPERILLRRLSVFAGGCSLEAVEAVCDDAPLARRDVLDLLTSLVDKSLVLVEAVEETTRYRLLETIRQYAAEKLAEAHETAELRRRHARWYAELSDRASAMLFGPDQIGWTARLGRELDNLRAAIRFAVEEPGLVEVGLRAIPPHRFWITIGAMTEPRDWLRNALAVATTVGETVDRSVHVRAWHTAGMLALFQGDFAAALAADERAGELARASGGPVEQSLVAMLRAQTLMNLADHAGALAAAAEYVRVARGEGWWGASAAFVLALVTRLSGDHARAVELHRAALEAARDFGDLFLIHHGLSNMGLAHCALGEHARARPLFEEALAMRRRMGDRWATVASLNDLADVDLADGHHPVAAARYQEALALYDEMADGGGTARSLLALATCAAAYGEHARALRLAGAGSALRSALKAPLSADERRRLDTALGPARAALGGVADATWRVGAALPVRQAVAEALAEPAARPVQPAGPTPRLEDASPPANSPLSPRQREVARLVARGLTNRQIANSLVISERTADRHVANILAKLGLANRVQVAASFGRSL